MRPLVTVRTTTVDPGSWATTPLLTKVIYSNGVGSCQPGTGAEVGYGLRHARGLVLTRVSARSGQSAFCAAAYRGAPLGLRLRLCTEQFVQTSPVSRLSRKLAEGRQLVGQSERDIPSDLRVGFAGVGINTSFGRDGVRVVRTVDDANKS
jgi:hypothetical protein